MHSYREMHAALVRLNNPRKETWLLASSLGMLAIMTSTNGLISLEACPVLQTIAIA